MVTKTLAGEWIRGKGQTWSGKKVKKPRDNAGPRALPYLGDYPREMIAGKKLGTIKDFVEKHRGTTSRDCIFVPGVVVGRPAYVTFCGKGISAARYSTLLAYGTPKHEGIQCRHLCGNGHLSCINPNHLSWGDASENRSDAAKHRHAGENVQDRIFSIGGKLT